MVKYIRLILPRLNLTSLAQRYFMQCLALITSSTLIGVVVGPMNIILDTYFYFLGVNHIQCTLLCVHTIRIVLARLKCAPHVYVSPPDLNSMPGRPGARA
jgi:hypothetical protein